MKKLLVILGPTATGKTDLALNLAKKFNGEIIACDSRQVYIGLDIGSGKMPGYKTSVKKFTGYWEVDGVKIHLYDVAHYKTQYTVKDYVEDASRAIDEIFKLGKLPIIVGGTGLYLKALLEGIPNLSVPTNVALRGQLEKLSLLELQTKLQMKDLKKWNGLNSSDRQNSRRLLRSLEVISMYPYRDQTSNSKLKSADLDILKIGLTSPIDDLRKRSFRRILSRLDLGMIKEVEELHKKGLSFERMRSLGLEFRVIAEYLQGLLNKEQLIEKLNLKIGQYAKRQKTWFKKQKNINWVDITIPNYSNKVEKQVSDWYNAAS